MAEVQDYAALSESSPVQIDEEKNQIASYETKPPRRPLWRRLITNIGFLVVVGAALGMLIGYLISLLHVAANEPGWSAKDIKGRKQDIDDALIVLGAPGKLFIDLLKCIVIPLVFFNITVVSVDMASNGTAIAMGWRTIVFYAFTSIFAALQGLFFILILKSQLTKGEAQTPWLKPTMKIKCPARAEKVDFQPKWEIPVKEDTEFPVVDSPKNLTSTYLTLNAISGNVECLPEGYDKIIGPEGIKSKKGHYINFEMEEQSPDFFLNRVPFDAKTKTPTVAQQIIRGIVYSIIQPNWTKMFVESKFLAIIFISVLTAFAIAKLEKRPESVLTFFKEMNQIFYSMLLIVIDFAPIAVFSLCLAAFGKEDDFKDLFSKLGVLFGASMLGFASHIFIFYPLVYFIFVRKNPFNHIKFFLPASVMAFATGSSAACLPVNMECARKRGGIPDHVKDFVLSIGSTINMDGSAVFITTCCVFLAVAEDRFQDCDIGCQIAKYIMIIALATLGSAGAAPVPSFGLVLIIIAYNTTFSTEGTPEAFSVVFPIMWLMDRFITVTNVTGDAYTVGVMAKFHEGLIVVDGETKPIVVDEEEGKKEDSSIEGIQDEA